jgi:anthranilate synthase component 2
MILLIDNYDSFSYNLYQLVGAIDPDIRVVRNDALSVDEIAELNPSRIIISPGPGRPADAGVCEAVIREFAGKIPILGVCLGHQAICEAFGGVVGYAKELMHGKPSLVSADTSSLLFRGLPGQFTVARYHSLAAEDASLPAELRVTARTADCEIMALEHRTHPVFGVQFHPESIMTPLGVQMLRNFLAA